MYFILNAFSNLITSHTLDGVVILDVLNNHIFGIQSHIHKQSSLFVVHLKRLYLLNTSFYFVQGLVRGVHYAIVVYIVSFPLVFYMVKTYSGLVLVVQ